MTKSTIENPRVVSREEWIAARKELLAKEKNLTRQRDALSPAEAERENQRRVMIANKDGERVVHRFPMLMGGERA